MGRKNVKDSEGPGIQERLWVWMKGVNQMDLRVVYKEERGERM